MTDPTPTKTARLSEESLAFATVLNAEAARADRAERLELATRRGRDAAIARAIAAEDRAIAAEQMVAELRAMLTTGRDIVIETSTSSRHTKWVEDAYDTLEAAAPIAGRWCLASERDEAMRGLDAEREVFRDMWLAMNAAIARADAAEASLAEWHVVVCAVGRDPATEHETGRAREDILDAARILAAPGLSIDEAASRIVAENSRLRHAAAEVLAWRLTDTTALASNPPQNAALFHAQRLLREAMGD